MKKFDSRIKKLEDKLLEGNRGALISIEEDGIIVNGKLELYEGKTKDDKKQEVITRLKNQGCNRVLNLDI
jgi:hypothetical protein